MAELMESLQLADLGTMSRATPPVGKAGESMRVLLVDPSPISRSCLAAALEMAPGLACDSTDNLEGLTIEHCRFLPELILIQCPSGPNASERLGAIIQRASVFFPKVPAVLLTGRSAPRTAELEAVKGLSGCIPATMCADLTVAALRLVSLGMAIYPRTTLQEWVRSIDRNVGELEHSHFSGAEGFPHTKRQTEVIEKLLEGLSNKAIAGRLGISESTVKVHVRAIMRRAGVVNRNQLVVRFLRPIMQG